jgi:YD repeat-containing protein
VQPNDFITYKQTGNGVKHEYDEENRRIKSIYPDGGIRRMKYDAAGNLVKDISPENYNEKTDDGPGRTYAYDTAGRLTEERNELGDIVRRFEYDALGCPATR